ncbi:hypothetical protein FE257_007676 [Aspergillus nanangensis]|uniref:N-acetyltransferase domain-containing protein n=1 Tax=Aspergillus nanangensis TaxID=2582783 RepID=A0AAD4CP87_ASPNN|nr:hypothetical protein FE257_007676 [Aspergillus nanangensis]
MSTPKYNYTFFRIPKDDTIPTSAQNYKQLRLHALSIAPTSFSSTHQIESTLPDTEWTHRLAAPNIETFICAATPSNPDEEATIWIGQLTLRGPLRHEEFILPDESGQPNPSARSNIPRELWQMLSLFTLPEHRGQGLGKRLCREALDYLFSDRRGKKGGGSPEVWVRLMVKPENHATVRLYRGLGFENVGVCTLAEALVANGDEHLLPKDTSGEKYTTRSGLIMLLKDY